MCVFDKTIFLGITLGFVLGSLFHFFVWEKRLLIEQIDNSILEKGIITFCLNIKMLNLLSNERKEF